MSKQNGDNSFILVINILKNVILIGISHMLNKNVLNIIENDHLASNILINII